jgi:DNA-binding CsgD family transcriptional regulator/PAS domain-containing protein
VREPSHEVSVLQEVVRRSILPVALVDLDGLRFVTGSPTAAAMLRQSDLDNLSLLSLVEDSPETRTALSFLRSGALDSYEAHRLLLEPRGDDVGMSMWVRGLAMRGFAGWALGILTLGDRDDATLALPPNLFASPTAIAVGTSDIAGDLHHLSPEIEALLGIPGEVFRGDSLYSWIHPSEAELLAAALERSRLSGAPAAVTARLRTQNGDWAPVRIVVKVGPAATGPRVGVAIVRDQQRAREEADRDAEVDPAALLGLAGEIRALDIVDAMALLPGDGDLPSHAEKLTEREWEVVARLLRGDRVPAIAQAVYLAPSTVRNHLSAVFRKLGVGSQQELISLFRGDGMRDQRPVTTPR